jgi:hypothetical protein
VRVQLAGVLAADHLPDPDDVPARGASGGDAPLHLLADLRRVRLAGAKHHADSRIQVLDGSHEVHDALLARDAADEEHVRDRWIDAVALQSVGAWIRMVEVGVDAVVDDVDALLANVEQAKHVLTGLPADGDHGIGRFERRALDPAAHLVAAAELLALPGP